MGWDSDRKGTWEEEKLVRAVCHLHSLVDLNLFYWITLK